MTHIIYVVHESLNLDKHLSIKRKILNQFLEIPNISHKLNKHVEKQWKHLIYPYMKSQIVEDRFWNKAHDTSNAT